MGLLPLLPGTGVVLLDELLGDGVLLDEPLEEGVLLDELLETSVVIGVVSAWARKSSVSKWSFRDLIRWVFSPLTGSVKLEKAQDNEASATVAGCSASPASVFVAADCS